MEKLIPRNVIQMDYRTKIYVANLYNAAGKDDTFRALNDEIINELKPIVASGKVEPLSYDNPYVVLMQVYESMQMFDDALKLVDRIREVYSKETGIEQSVGQIRARLLAEQSAARKDSLAKSGPSPSQPQKIAPEKGK
jgi:nucleotidyltransferase/DNA polymerase involved in DNA repair